MVHPLPRSQMGSASQASGLNLRETKTILYVHGVTEIGGAERDLLLILDRLSSFKYRALVVCPERGPLQDELSHRKIETRSVPLPAWRKLRSYPWRPAAVRCLRNVIVAERPDLLHVNDIWWVPQTLRASMGLQVPILAHVRQDLEPRKARRYQLDCPDLVFAVSHHIRQSLECAGVAKNRLRTIYSGLEMSGVPNQEIGIKIRGQLGIPASAPVLGTVANVFPHKGYEVVLRALPKIVAQVPEVQYVIVGAGNRAYEQRLRSLVHELELSNRVHFAGFQQFVYPWLAALDIYVHPAHLEAFGIAVLEAMAMRKPVVATATGGIPEIVRDGETGVLVPPGDADALARAVVNLLADSPRRVAFGQAGRDRLASCFTVDAMMSQLTAVYDTLMRRTIPATEPVLE